jgi:hypothetical protein
MYMVYTQMQHDAAQHNQGTAQKVTPPLDGPCFSRPMKKTVALRKNGVSQP